MNVYRPPEQLPWYYQPDPPPPLKWYQYTKPEPKPRPVRVAPAPFVVAIPSPGQTNHVLHLLLTVFTCGLWAPMWLIVTIVNSYRKPGAPRF